MFFVPFVLLGMSLLKFAWRIQRMLLVPALLPVTTTPR